VKKKKERKNMKVELIFSLVVSWLGLLLASDLFPECEYWASNGTISYSSIRSTLSFSSKYTRQPPIILCHEKPQIMWSLCLRSCYKYAKDQNSQCSAWAKQGECMKNPSYMQVHCAPSCGLSIAWNPFLRNDLGISNVTLHSNIIEKLLQPCQVPLNLLNIADILSDRLSLYLQGNFDYLWSLYLQSPLEYNNIVGITELFSYIYKIYEMIYRIHSTNQTEIAVLTQQLAVIHNSLLNVHFSDPSSSSSGFTSASSSGNAPSMTIFPEYVDELSRQLPVWMNQLTVHYEKVHELANSFTTPSFSKPSRSSNKFLSISQCNEYDHLEISKINFFYFEECTQETRYCLDFHSNYHSSGSYNDHLKDENELPIPPSEFSTFSAFSSHSSSSTSRKRNLPTTQKLSNGVEIPVLGIGMNTANVLDNLQMIIQAINRGYRLLEITLDDPNFDASLGTTLQSIFETNHPHLRREELFIVLRFSNHSYSYDLEGMDDLSASSAFGFSSFSGSSPSNDYFTFVQDHIKNRMSALQLGYIDLLLLDTPPVSTTDRVSIWQAMEKLYREGYVSSIGVANFDSLSLQDLLSTAQVKPMVIENKLDIYHYTTISSPLLSTLQEINNLLLLLEENQILLIGYGPFSGYPYLLKPLYDPIIHHVANLHTLLNHNSTRSMKKGSEKKNSFGSVPTEKPSKLEEKKVLSPDLLQKRKDPKVKITPKRKNHIDRGQNEEEIRVSNSGEATEGLNIPWNHENSNDDITTLGKNHDFITEVKELSKDDIITPAQILLRYFLEQKMVLVFQSHSDEHLEENLKVLDMLPLTDYEKNLIESIQYIIGNYGFTRNG
jgi:diketogulonate reductase-like aldo/keto reductase